MIRVVGWDIGGANIKAACIETGEKHGGRVRVESRPFEIWREKERLPEMVRSTMDVIAPGERPAAMAVTMTAELSDVFETKREGVEFVLESIQSCFPTVPGYALSLSGEFLSLSEARLRPLEFAAANWLASAYYVARHHPNCILVDVGSTTTDIVPILDRKVCAGGRTDMERLASGELVFTGILRTNLAAIVRSVPVAGRSCRVAAEYFAVSGDVHLILGFLQAEDYTCTTPDGRPPSVDSARRRLARLVCADAEMLSAAEIDEMARHIYQRQLCQVQDGLNQVLSRRPELRKHPAVVLGTGAFLGTEAARNLGLEIGESAGILGREGSPAAPLGAAAPCVAAAHLLAEQLGIFSETKDASKLGKSSGLRNRK